jgi:hypothetical protein
VVVQVYSAVAVPLLWLQLPFSVSAQVHFDAKLKSGQPPPSNGKRSLRGADKHILWMFCNI